MNRGLDAVTAQAFFAGVRQDTAVLRPDRMQGFFQTEIADFFRKRISQDRIDRGRAMAAWHNAAFARTEAEYGIARGVLLAFWAFETEYGMFRGDFNTRDALVMSAQDFRRPEWFGGQVCATVKPCAQGEFDLGHTTGAWADAIGMVQMLPQDILDNGVYAGEHMELKTSAPDALCSRGRMPSLLGWQAGGGCKVLFCPHKWTDQR